MFRIGFLVTIICFVLFSFVHGSAFGLDYYSFRTPNRLLSSLQYHGSVYEQSIVPDNVHFSIASQSRYISCTFYIIIISLYHYHILISLAFFFFFFWVSLPWRNMCTVSGPFLFFKNALRYRRGPVVLVDTLLSALCGVHSRDRFIRT